MIKYYINFIILFFTFSNISAQEIIKKSTHHFTITNDSLKGKGAEIFKSKIAESQFFLIGEQHDVSQLETMVKSLVPFLKKQGFNNYVAEVGPLAAKKLEELGKQKKLLEKFNRKYSDYIVGAPFGFFGTVEEGKTLNQIVDYGINIWGVDFENYNSYLFILDLLLENSNKSKLIHEKYKEANNYIKSEYKKGKNGFNPELAKNLLKSKELESYFNAVNNPKNRIVINELKKSLQIYAGQGKGFWYPRVENMKRNFISQYKELENTDSKKVFIKLGAVHMAKGTSYSGFQELGNTIYELANYNFKKSFSVLSFSRYSLNSNNEIIDVIEKEDAEILQYAQPDQWTLIDLKEIEKLSIENKVKLSGTIKGYIQKFDAILIPPATKESEKNY